MLSAEKVTILDEILIAHTINRKTSLSSTRSVSYHCALDALVALRDFLFKNGMMQKRQRDFYNYIVVFLEWHLNTLSGEAFNKLFQDVKLFISSFDINTKTFMMSLFFLLIDESLICLLKSIFFFKRSGS